MRAFMPEGFSGHASRFGPAMTSTAELTSPSSANTPQIGVIDSDYTLEHKYTRTDGRIYLSGVQALVRLPLMQRLRDQAAGLNTAGFISGYRG
jgi:indolepyruvate ferredoxin oxidoreductase